MRLPEATVSSAKEAPRSGSRWDTLSTEIALINRYTFEVGHNIRRREVRSVRLSNHSRILTPNLHHGDKSIAVARAE